MNKSYLRLLGICLLGLFLVWLPLSTEEETKDESEPAARELLLKAVENMDQTEGFGFEGEENTTEEDSGSGQLTTKKSTAEGAWQKEFNLTYANILGEGKDIVIYQKGKQTVKEEATGDAWQLVRQPPFSPILPALKWFRTHKNLWKDVKFSGVEKLKGKDCKIVEAFLNPQRNHINLNSSFRLSFEMLESSDLLYKVWIGEKDALPYEINLSVTMKLDPAVVVEWLDDGGMGKIANLGKNPRGTLPPIIQKTTMEISLNYEATKKLAFKIPEKVKELFGIATNPVAQKLLLQALKNLDQTKGFRFEMKGITETETPEGGTEKESTITGIWQSPDIVYTRIVNEEGETEIYQRDTENALRNSESEEWEFVPRHTFPSPIEQIKTYQNHLGNVTFSGEAELRGNKCKIVQACPNSEYYYSFYESQGQPHIVSTHEKITEALYKIWINEKDLLPYKVIFSFALKRDARPGLVPIVPITEKRTIEISFDYGPPVEVKIPEELKEPLGCLTDPEAQKAMLLTLEKISQTKGFRFETRETVQADFVDKGTSETESTMKGSWQSPDMIHCQETSDEKDYEYYQKGDKTIGKDSEGEQWQRLHQGAAPSPITQINHLKNYLKNIRFTGEEKLRNKNCRVIVASLKREGCEKILERFPSPIKLLRKKKFADPLYKVWIGKNDTLPYRLMISFSVSRSGPIQDCEPRFLVKRGSFGKDGKVEIDIYISPVEEDGEIYREGDVPIAQEIILEIDLFDYDKDIEIKIPKEAKELLEKEKKKSQ